MLSSKVLCRKVLSTPKTTSATGLSLVRMIWLTTVPVSAPCTTSTSMPVSASKASSTPSLRAKES